MCQGRGPFFSCHPVVLTIGFNKSLLTAVIPMPELADGMKNLARCFFKLGGAIRAACIPNW